jgi:hypothetical protein
MTYETTTTLQPAQVIAWAKVFFAERNPNNSAFPEKEGPNFLSLRGQGGEEIALTAIGGDGTTRVRASTLFFDQALGRFFSTLPGSSESAA